VAYRDRLREDAASWASIAPALAAFGIDPAPIGAVRGLAAAAGELSRLGDSPELRDADAAFAAADPRLACRESRAAIVAARAAGFAGKPPPDRGASLHDWYAWSLGVRRER
jgi:hypothetical protein